MTDHPQTVTERFLRHGVAGGFVLWDSPEEEQQMFEMLHQFPRKWVSEMHVSSLLLDPSLWRAAGRSLGWDEYSEEYRNLYGLEETWLSKWKGLLDHLASRPGDVEGYLSKITGGKEN